MTAPPYRFFCRNGRGSTRLLGCEEPVHCAQRGVCNHEHLLACTRKQACSHTVLSNRACPPDCPFGTVRRDPQECARLMIYLMWWEPVDV